MHVASEVSIDCPGDHYHVQLIGGRAKSAEKYTAELLAALIRGMRAQLRSDKVLGALDAGVTVEEPDLLETEGPDDGVGETFDRTTGAVLDPKLVKNGRADEMGYMKQLKVFERRTVAECHERTGRGPIPTGWVDINKGDAVRPEVRCRLVVQETNRRATIAKDDMVATLAATPPLESLRMLIRMTMTDEGGAEPRHITLIEISRAHLHSGLDREFYVVAPKEDDGCADGWCWLLRKAMSGLRDVGRAFDRLCESVMDEIGFTVGAGSVCLYWHQQRRIGVYRRGDDFIGSGVRTELNWFKDELGQRLIVEVLAILRPRADLGEGQEVTCLNRILRWWPMGPLGQGED